jgi:hypothetical protein
MSVIPEKIKSTTSISSESSTTVETVEDKDDVALEKIIDSAEDDLDDVIRYKSLATVTLPDFVITGIATSDVFGDDYYGDDHEADCDETVTAGINRLGINNETLFYVVARAQIDGGAKVSVANLLTLLHKVNFYSKKFKCKIRMHGATPKDIIQPLAEGYLRVPALTTEGYVDVLCYFSSHFTSTLLSDRSVVMATGNHWCNSGQFINKLFASDEETLQQDLLSGQIDLNTKRYNLDYGTCLLTCLYCFRQTGNLSIPGIIRSGLCFTEPLIPADLPASYAKATIYNLKQKALQDDPVFQVDFKRKHLELIYNYQQKEYVKLMSILESLHDEYYEACINLPFHKYTGASTPANALNKKAEALL